MDSSSNHKIVESYSQSLYNIKKLNKIIYYKAYKKMTTLGGFTVLQSAKSDSQSKNEIVESTVKKKRDRGNKSTKSRPSSSMLAKIRETQANRLAEEEKRKQGELKKRIEDELRAKELFEQQRKEKLELRARRKNENAESRQKEKILQSRKAAILKYGLLPDLITGLSNDQNFQIRDKKVVAKPDTKSHGR